MLSGVTRRAAILLDDPSYWIFLWVVSDGSFLIFANDGNNDNGNDNNDDDDDETDFVVSHSPFFYWQLLTTASRNWMTAPWTMYTSFSRN